MTNSEWARRPIRPACLKRKKNSNNLTSETTFYTGIIFRQKYLSSSIKIISIKFWVWMLEPWLQKKNDNTLTDETKTISSIKIF